jgi:hypothetical protein
LIRARLAGVVHEQLLAGQVLLLRLAGRDGALGLNKDIRASPDDTASQAWARAIHSASPRWDAAFGRGG